MKIQLGWMMTLAPPRTLRGPLSRKVRAVALIVAFVASIIATLMGATSSMSATEAQEVAKEIEEEITCLMSVPVIFGNNFMHCLIMFTPILGPLYGLYVLHSTGKVLAALALVHEVNPISLFGVTFLFPHAWIEYIAYALAMSQSVCLIVGAAQRRLKNEAINACIAITICALLLLLAAAIELAIANIISVSFM